MKKVNLNFTEEEKNTLGDKWGGLGFLKDPNEIQKYNTSIGMEYAGVLLIGDLKGKYDERLDTLIFPVIHRTFKGLGEKKDTTMILKYILSILLDLNNEITIGNLNGVDEATFLNSFCDNYKL